jgi:hypothetical protein
MTEQDAAWIQILQVPGCPLVSRVRKTVARALARLEMRAEVREVVGNYPSPTLLIDGRDLTGREWDECGACRLDLPTAEQVLAALRFRGELIGEVSRHERGT